MPIRRFALAALLVTPLAQGETSEVGTWFTCHSGTPEFAPYSLVSVERDGSTYTAIQEWGANYAQSGTASPVNGRLVFRGCRTWRGEVSPDCDESRPPVFHSITVAEANAKPANRQAPLKLDQTIKTSSAELQALIRKCEALRTKASRVR